MTLLRQGFHLRQGFGGQDGGRAVLRTIAVLIAVAAVVDPAWSIDRHEATRLVVVDLAEGSVETSVGALRTALPGWQIEHRDGSSLRIPCAADERCVVVADGSIDADLPSDIGAPSMIAVRNDREPNVALRTAIAPSAHVSAAGVMQVELRRTGAIVETAIVIRDGGAVVGSATHKWAEGVTATVDVPWWPLDAGARTLQVEATPVAGESTAVDNRIDVGVTVLAGRVPVLVFDARANWSSTFVRRALEDDPRISVEHRARLAPSLTAGTRSGVLDAATLEATPVVIVGDPDALSAADVALLERFVRVRGGSLILLPERRITGPAERLLAGQWSEHLVPAPERVGALQASEVLRVSDLPVTAGVIARSGAAPSIVSLPLGEGRVLVSGAMDAWRYRDQGSGIGDQGAFDRFWTSLVSDAALAGAALRLDPDKTLAASGERVRFSVRSRSFDARADSAVEVTAQCGEAAATPVRMWPAGAAGEFTGELAASGASCELVATAHSQVTRASIAVSERPARGVDVTLAKLERAVVDGGGTVSAVGDEPQLARQLSSSFTPTSRIVSVRPMRAAWWMFPFAGCLAVEWWLRRRGGLR